MVCLIFHAGYLREGHLPGPEELRAAPGRRGDVPVPGGRLPDARLSGLPGRVSTGEPRCTDSRQQEQLWLEACRQSERRWTVDDVECFPIFKTM